MAATFLPISSNNSPKENWRQAADQSLNQIGKLCSTRIINVPTPLSRIRVHTTIKKHVKILFTVWLTMDLYYTMKMSFDFRQNPQKEKHLRNQIEFSRSMITEQENANIQDKNENRLSLARNGWTPRFHMNLTFVADNLHRVCKLLSK